MSLTDLLKKLDFIFLSILKNSWIRFTPLEKIKFLCFIFFWNSEFTEPSNERPTSILFLIISKSIFISLIVILKPWPAKGWTLCNKSPNANIFLWWYDLKFNDFNSKLFISKGNNIFCNIVYTGKKIRLYEKKILLHFNKLNYFLGVSVVNGVLLLKMLSKDITEIRSFLDDLIKIFDENFNLPRIWSF